MAHAASTPEHLHHFESPEQQREASFFGMWVFLVTEVMFFAALFLAYTIYRSANVEAFAAASRHLDIQLGGINTVILIGSSLTMALAVWAAQQGRRGLLLGYLTATLVLGSAFLGVKSVEYSHKFHDHLFPGPAFEWIGPRADAAEMFFSIYFAMTGLHALHMVIGAGILLVLIVGAWRGKYGRKYYTPIECFGLYWHFVDLIWIFLFPLLYLIGVADGGH